MSAEPESPASGDVSPEVPGVAARQPSGNASFTALSDPIEERRIVVAQGMDFHNDCKLGILGWQLPQKINLKPNADRRRSESRPLQDLIINSDGSAEYYSAPQGVHYFLSFVNNKEEFRSALMTPGIMVIYAGHARYGRGPCFSDPALHEEHDAHALCPPSHENWGDGVDHAQWGQFKWGYSFIPIPASEILHHGYTATPASGDIDLPAASFRGDRHPDIAVKRLRVVTLDQLVDEIRAVKDDIERRLAARPAAATPEDLEGVVENLPSSLRTQLVSTSAEGFWVQDKEHRFLGRKYIVPEVVLAAGWEGTTVSPSDLGGTEIQCRCLCHFGCSTFKHNHKILRRLEYKNWRREGNERYAYFTTALAYNIATNFWLYHVLKYNRRNAFASWKPLLEYVVKETNRDLRHARVGFEVI